MSKEFVLPASVDHRQIRQIDLLVADQVPTDKSIEWALSTNAETLAYSLGYLVVRPDLEPVGKIIIGDLAIHRFFQTRFESVYVRKVEYTSGTVEWRIAKFGDLEWSRYSGNFKK